MKEIKLTKQKHVAIVAHDNKKKEMLDWIEDHKHLLREHTLYATGTTGKLVEEKLNKEVIKFKSGPLGGDQQIGAKIAEGIIDTLFFFWDPLEAQPHEPDVKALLRIAVLYNIPTASNSSTADYLINSPLFDKEYTIKRMDFDDYINRKL